MKRKQDGESGGSRAADAEGDLAVLGAGSGVEDGSRDRTRDVAHEREPENGDAENPKSINRQRVRARVRERIVELGSPDESVRYDARVMLCWSLQADDDYISKTTPKEIAEALTDELGAEHRGAVEWTTVEQNGCEAARHRRRMDKHPEEIARYQLRAEAHAKRVLEFTDDTLAGLETIPIDSAMNAKMRAEAGAKVLDQAEKVIEREGRMLGALASGGPNITIINESNAAKIEFRVGGSRMSGAEVLADAMLCRELKAWLQSHGHALTPIEARVELAEILGRHMGDGGVVEMPALPSRTEDR